MWPTDLCEPENHEKLDHFKECWTPWEKNIIISWQILKLDMPLLDNLMKNEVVLVVANLTSHHKILS